MFSACSGTPSLWISLLLFRLGGESLPLKSGELGDHAVEILVGPRAKAFGIEQIGVGDDRRGAFADTAMGCQPIATDCAAAVE